MKPDWVPGEHYCEADLPFEVYGAAISYAYEDAEGRFCVSNGEYGSQVNYCPFCGTKAHRRAT